MLAGKKSAILKTDFYFIFLVVVLIKDGSQESDRPGESGTVGVSSGPTGVTGPARFGLFCGLGGRTPHAPRIQQAPGLTRRLCTAGSLARVHVRT